jgi:uncharacterized membrane-anchored protein
MKQNLRLIIGLVVLLGIAGSFILYLSWPLITGKTVILATHPVDPFDILMGQYININYDISNIPAIENAKDGNEVYVVITEDKDNLWKYQEALLTIPQDQTFIRGKIKSIYGDQMRIEYGIEQYFFERNAQLPISNLTVEIKISNFGQARISKLLHNGKPAEIEYKNVSITS